MRRVHHLCAVALFAVIVSSTAAAAPRSGEQISIWFDTGGSIGAPYGTIVQNGAIQACIDLGCDLTLLYSDWDPAKMLANMRKAIAAQPDGIVIMGHPGDGAYAPLVEEAQAKHILVTATDTALPLLQKKYTSDGFGYTGQQNYQRGVSLAQEALQRSQLQIGDRVLVWGLKQMPIRGRSTIAMIETLARADIKVDYLEISRTIDQAPETGAAALAAQLKKRPDTQMVLIDHSGLTSKVGQLLESIKVAPDALFVAGFDLSPETTTALKSGYVDLVGDGQPYLQGYLPVVQIVLSKRLGFSGLTINTGNGFISAENLEQIAPLAQQALR